MKRISERGRKARPRVALAALTALLLLHRPGQGHEPANPRVDANLATGLDVSDSITRHQLWMEFEGLARAIDHESFLEVVTEGQHGRVAIAIFTWSGESRQRAVVPWTIINDVSSARRAAATVRAAGRIYGSALPLEEHPFGPSPGGLSDVSGALAYGSALLMQAPFSSHRSVLNICTNGTDNVGVGPDRVRDRTVLGGVVINGLAIGGRPRIVRFLRDHVRGGPGSFVLTLGVAGDMFEAMLQKLLQDLILSAASDARQG